MLKLKNDKAFIQNIIKNDKKFYIISFLFSLITLYGFFIGYQSKDIIKEIQYKKDSIQEIEQNIETSNIEIRKIRKEYKNVPKSFADNSKNAHLILQQLIKDSKMFDITINFIADPVKGVSSGEIDFTKENKKDIDSDLSVFSGRLEVRYANYKDLKSYINHISEKYTITIDSILVENNNAHIKVSLYLKHI